MKTSHAETWMQRKVAYVLFPLAIAMGGIPSLSDALVPTPLQIGAAHPVLDHNGHHMPGDGSIPYDERPLVQVLRTDDGVIHPPNPLTGEPHEGNEVVATARIGSLIAPYVENSGLFGVAISSNRPQDGVELFVRVYNRPTIEESIFYSQSQVMYVNGNEELFAELGPVQNLLDAAEYRLDQYGLPLLWKLDNLGDAYVDIHTDMDGDGFTVWEEFVAGTDPDDADSRFVVTSLRTLYEEGEQVVEEGGQWITQQVFDVIGEVLSWQSASGRIYTLEYATNLMGEGAFEVLAADIPGTPPENFFTNLMTPGDVPIFYRARVMWPDEPVFDPPAE